MPGQPDRSSVPVLFPHVSVSLRALARQRGVARAALLIVLMLLALATGVAGWVLHRAAAEDGAAAPSDAPAQPSSAAAPADDPTTDALLTRARGEVAVHHLLSPASANAVELYLQVRQREPANPAADQALRELFPFAAEQAAATVRDGDLAEARRQLALLARADPANYTVTLLRQQLEARAAPTAGRAAAAAPSEHLPVAVAPAVSSPLADRRPTRSPTPAPAASSAPSAPASAVIPRPAQTATLPVLTRRSEPYYPKDARRTRREGWVELQFTVAADGSVTHAEVVDAQPKNVFDRAAVTAVERWTFSPGTRDGRPVAMRIRQRLEFHL